MKPFKKRAELETNRQEILANVEVIEIGSEIGSTVKIHSDLGHDCT